MKFMPGMHGWKGHHCGPPMPRFHPLMLLVPATVVATLLASVCLTMIMVKQLETLSATNALDTLGDRLSDVEKAELEGRIRQQLFPG